MYNIYNMVYVPTRIMVKKDKDISMTREDHEKMRKSAGFKYKFTITEVKPYDHFKFLETLSKLQKRGDKKSNQKEQ